MKVALRQLRYLVECAAQAPSTHNTQPWMFMLGSIGHDEIHVWADRSRWLPVVDPDRREMHLSIGCALENMLVAAESLGMDVGVRYFPDPAQEDFVALVRVGGTAAPTERGRLAAAIPHRHTAYVRFDGRPIDARVRAELEAVATEPEVRLIVVDSAVTRRAVENLVMRADALQFSDAAFREELGRCIGRGAYGAPWLLAKLEQLAVSWLDLGESAGRRDAEVLMSSPLVALVATTEDTRRARVRAGQVFERLHLTATTRGVSVQPMNQAVQVQEVRRELLPVVAPGDGAGLHAQMLMRLGYTGEAMASPPRRSLEEILGDAE
jgi:hypothetical protein